MTFNPITPVTETRPLHAVLFDLDGTLLDTAPGFVHCLNVMRSKADLPEITLDHLRPFVSKGSAAMVKRAYDITEEAPEFAPLKQEFLDLYRNNLTVNTQWFDGITELWQNLSERDIPWGIVTNKPFWLTEPLLTELNILDKVKCLVCGDTLSVNKPAPEPLLHAAKLLNMPPEEILFLGDSDIDITAARAANMFAVLASYGYVDEDIDLSKWLPDAIIFHPSEVASYLL